MTVELRLSLANAIMTQSTPSRVWHTQSVHNLPRMPYLADVKSDNIPPMERANRFMSP